MDYYFDTSSLVALARYYHPFDKENHLYDYVEAKFLGKELVILDVILNETKRKRPNLGPGLIWLR